ncbi:hypothetical protein ASPZODRAFT_117902 [Penicilliopsis zonata CBS 506.65]|uniref:Amino acid transporter transmembrane domain-containing protein n=1 Tax=Penicilliopsis zonata CBS 506.65 TaxID=1073090 RepID=A0A1L9SFM8_9EURO|nr:hypothetical protein ASPZODRAFT_117902 [Penicilliopsis zonata CBS 506.65]OJJ46085.1 hypothetical protein ASPZODRAFT_117902 [Penicilliopsis zonata CBS 506.65]
MSAQIVDPPPVAADLEDGPLEKRIDKKLDEDSPSVPVDAFGDEENAEVKYKVLKWWQCGLLMVAETVSLGVLSLPAAVAKLGLVPSVILLVGLGILSTYTGYVIGQFKWRYPHIHSMADAGEVLMGRFGRELLGTGQILFLVFIMASHLLTFTVAMNTITGHATCSIVFGVVGLVLSCICSLPRTLSKMSWLSLVSFASVVSAVFVTMIALGITQPGSGVAATVPTTLYTGFGAVTNMVTAFSGHVAFFGLMAELKDPRDYPKALCLLQGSDISLYLIAALVIYRYAGVDVTSPALGSAGHTVAKVAYGVALPTIVIAGVINGHVAVKYVYVRLFRGTSRMHGRDWLAVSSWIGIAFSLWVLAWVIAEAIPIFSDLLSLITALFASWFTYGLAGLFWLHLNRGRYWSSPRKMLLSVLNLCIVGMGACLCGLGLYISGKAIHDDTAGVSFSCANNV